MRIIKKMTHSQFARRLAIFLGMKKMLVALTVLIVALLSLAGCSNNPEDSPCGATVEPGKEWLVPFDDGKTCIATRFFVGNEVGIMRFAVQPGPAHWTSPLLVDGAEVDWIVAEWANTPDNFPLINISTWLGDSMRLDWTLDDGTGRLIDCHANVKPNGQYTVTCSAR
jgi:hypothetical protein